MSKVQSLEDLKKILDKVEKGNPWLIELDGGKHFFAISDDDYYILRNIKEIMEDDIKDNRGQKVKIVSNNINEELSFEQYEILKKQINEALDKTLKPKAEKLN